MINHFFILLLLLFCFVICNNIQFVHSSTSSSSSVRSNKHITPSNGEIEMYEYIGNQYEGHATMEYFELCSFLNRYVLPNLVQPELEIVSSGNVDVQVNSAEDILVLYFNLSPSNDPYLVNISITTLDPLSTTFIFNLTCKSINENNLIIVPENDRVVQLDSGYGFFYISIKGLEFPIYNLMEYMSINSVTISSVVIITKELYMVNYGYYMFESFDFSGSIVFKTKEFVFEISAAYNTTKYQLIQDTPYPSTFTDSSPYHEYSKNLSPLIQFTSNLTNDQVYLVSSFGSIVYSTPKLINQFNNNNIIYNTYIMPLINYDSQSLYQYSLSYNNGDQLGLKNYSINYIVSQVLQPPIGKMVAVSNALVLTFDSASYSYSNTPFKYSFYSYELVTQFPFGFYGSSDTVFYYTASFHSLPSSSLGGDSFSIQEYPWGNTKTEYDNPDTSNNAGTVAPSILLFEIIPIVGFKYLLRIQISTGVGISKIGVLEGENIRYYGYETLVSGDMNNGLYELIVNDISTVKYLEVVDIYNNKNIKKELNTTCLDSNNVPVLLESPVPKVDLDIYDISFKINDMDVLNKPCYNSIYFNSSTLPIDYPLQFRLLDPVSYSFTSLHDNQDPIPIRWSEKFKLFYCDFIVPKNTITGVIPFIIMSPYASIHSSMLLSSSNISLRVSNSILDNDGPIITSIENLYPQREGWRFTIKDSVNGFSNGYIKVSGSLDYTPITINFTSRNINMGGTIYSGTLDVYLSIPPPCLTQDYVIEYIYLEDTNKRYSTFSRYDPIKQPEKNPLRTLTELSDLGRSGILKTSTISCSSNDGSIDTSPPVISIESYSLIVDTGSNNRKFEISFNSEDKESNMMINTSPVVYLMASNYKMVECQSKVVSFSAYIPEDFNGSNVTYDCSVELPVGFGYPDTLLLSIYGAVNQYGLYSGYNNLNIDPITISYSLQPLVTGYEALYYYSKQDIIIYGKLLSGTTDISIIYSNGTSKSYTPKRIISETVLVIENDDSIDIIGPFNVTVSTLYESQTYTNKITIYPTYYEKTNSVTPTSPPTPTNKPQQCLGSPVCGGIDHGYCVNNQGCVCYSPWVGRDCLSKVIIVPQPSVNNTDPTIEIPVTDDDSNSNEIDNIFYKSLISLVSLIELDINNKPVDEYKFEKWIFDQINPSTSQYFTNITVKDNSSGGSIEQLVNVTTTLIWFENETFIEFANQNLTMNPSSIKYTVYITSYPFKSKLNKLQLVMSASIVSSKTNDICSSKEFGDTTSGDNSNYLQIQIENKSLYGRFIKRGIINYGRSIVTLENELLDAQMKPISSPSQVQSYIGITIPYWYEGSAIIDPDFSVLVNPNSASSSSSSSICTSKSSKLSNTKIAGIAIGGFAFVCVVTVSIIYIVYKTKQKKRFIKTIDHKLKSLN